MTDHRGRNEERLRRALHGYAERVEPGPDQWAKVEARHFAATHSSRSRRGLLSLSATAIVAACVLLVAGILVRPEQVRPPVAQADFVGPEVPQYAGVVPAPEFPAGSTMAAIQARGYIRVGIKFDQPNFGLEDPATGAVHGFDAEIAKLIAVGIFGGRVSDLGERIRWQPVVSRNREALLEEGEVDMVVATYSITSDREKRVDFAGPYYLARQDILIRADDRSIRGIDDLTGKKVCTAQGSTSQQNLAARNPAALVVLRDTYSECATALLGGHVDAVTTDQGILAGYAHQSGGSFRTVNNPFSDEHYGIGIHKGDEVFRAFLNRRLGEVEANGDWSRAARYSLANIESLPPPITGG
jgi:glutamate transport system substrate-binding protein